MNFQTLIQRTRLRLRWLRAVRWGSWGLIGGLVVAFVYLFLSTFQWLESSSTALWPLLVAGVGGVLALLGLLMPVHTRRMLYKLDRALRSGEVLLTLHDLKTRANAHEFLPLLERRYQALAPQPARVFRLNRGDGKRAGGILGLLVLNLVLAGFGPQVVLFTGLPLGSASHERAASELDALANKLLAEELESRFDGVRQALEDLGLQPQAAGRDDGAAPEESLIQLYQNLKQAQSQVLGLTSSLQQQQGTQGAGDLSEQQRQQQREALENLQKQLDQVLGQLGEGQRGEGPPPSQTELENALNALPQDDPLRHELEEALRQGDPTQQQEALQQAQNHLQDRFDADRQLEAMRDRLERWMDGQPQSERGDQATPGPNEGKTQPGDAPPQGADPQPSPAEDGKPGQSQSQQDGQPGSDPQRSQEGLGKGEEAGVGEGGQDQRSRPPGWDPKYKEAEIPQDMVPADSLEEWLSRGVPVETHDQPGQPAQFRLSYDQVEALLNLRDLSPEMRDVVRLYFLQIIGQLNRPQNDP